MPTAIKAVESWMSQPIQEDFWNEVKDDLFHSGDFTFETKFHKIRGDCLTDAKFIEGVKVEDGVLTLTIGS